MATALRTQELERDVEEQDTADGLQVGDAQEDGGQRGKENAQTDRAGATEMIALRRFSAEGCVPPSQ